ncbi:MAG: hypothetical protein R3C51_03210 [Parvularculaceae bacterium]
MSREKTSVVSLRLQASEVEALRERAARVRGTHTALARELIRTGLTAGDGPAPAERLMRFERKLAAVDQNTQAILARSEAQAEALAHLAAMLDALIAALSGGDAATDQESAHEPDGAYSR